MPTEESHRCWPTRRLLLQGLAGSLLLAAALPRLRARYGPPLSNVHPSTAPSPPADYRTETLRALVATVIPGAPDEPGGADADIHESLIEVLDTVQPDASLTAAMYLDELSAEMRGPEAVFTSLTPGDRDLVLTGMCAHPDSSVRALGHFLIVGTTVLFYSEVGATRVARKKQAGLLPASASGPWEQSGYRGPALDVGTAAG